MAKGIKLFYIKERENPQLGTYFVPMGQLSKTEARGYESPSYGYNTMHQFENEELYTQRIKELKKQKKRVH